MPDVLGRQPAVEHPNVHAHTRARARWAISLGNTRARETFGAVSSTYVPHGGVFCKLRIDVEEHGQVNLFMWVQPLLLEAEALNLVKVLASIERNNVVGRDANDCIIRGVGCCVEGERSLAGNDLSRARCSRWHAVVKQTRKRSGCGSAWARVHGGERPTPRTHGGTIAAPRRWPTAKREGSR